MFFGILFWVILCGLAGWVASERGRSGLGVFFLSLVLSPLVGLIVAFSLSRREKLERTAGASETKKCPRCKELIKVDAFVCRFCDFEFPFADMAVREHLLRVRSLVSEGLNDDEIAVRLNNQGIKCLTNDGVWNANLVSNIRRDFMLGTP